MIFLSIAGFCLRKNWCCLGSHLAKAAEQEQEVKQEKLENPKDEDREDSKETAGKLSLPSGPGRDEKGVTPDNFRQVAVTNFGAVMLVKTAHAV